MFTRIPFLSASQKEISLVSSNQSLIFNQFKKGLNLAALVIIAIAIQLMLPAQASSQITVIERLSPDANLGEYNIGGGDHGYKFTVPGTEPLLLSSIEVVVRGSNAIQSFYIANDEGNDRPNDILETFVFNVKGAKKGKLITAQSVSTPLLLPGESYWIVAKDEGTGLGWSVYDPFLPEVEFSRLTGGIWVTGTREPTQFAVRATPVGGVVDNEEIVLIDFLSPDEDVLGTYTTQNNDQGFQFIIPGAGDDPKLLSKIQVILRGSGEQTFSIREDLEGQPGDLLETFTFNVKGAKNSFKDFEANSVSRPMLIPGEYYWIVAHASGSNIQWAIFEPPIPAFYAIFAFGSWLTEVDKDVAQYAIFGSSAPIEPPANKKTMEIAQEIIDVMKSPGCLNCHAVSATGHVPGGDLAYGLPPIGIHSAFDPATVMPSDCTSCHEDTLDDVLPFSTVDVDWHAAPAEFDFRASAGELKTDAELCNMARNPGATALDPLDHLTGDPLILWAVTGGLLPFNPVPPEPAFDGTLAQWQRLISQWVKKDLWCPPLVSVELEEGPALMPKALSGDLLIPEDDAGIIRVTPLGSVSQFLTVAQITAVTGAGSAQVKGIAVDENGNVFFVDRESGQILKESSTGTLSILTSVAQMDALVTGDEYLISQMTIGNDGKLYLPLTNIIDPPMNNLILESYIVKVDTTTGIPEVFISNTDIDTALSDFMVTNEVSLDDITAGAGGILYVKAGLGTPLVFGGLSAILKIMPSGEIFILTRENETSTADGIGRPDGMMPRVPGDPGRRDILVATELLDTGDSSDRIVRVSPIGEISDFYSSADLAICNGGGGVDFDGGLTFSSDDLNGKLYFTDDSTDAVYEINLTDGEPTGCSLLASEADIQAATGVSPDMDGDIVILPAP